MKSDRCPILDLTCAVAYRKRGCRCASCKAHRARAERRRLLNRKLDVLADEFVRAVRADIHYVEDFVRAFQSSKRHTNGE